LSKSVSVAILAANPALSAILAHALCNEGYTVATFAGVEALAAHLRGVETDAVVLDADLPGAPALDIARGLRQHPPRASDDLAIIVISRTSAATHRQLLAAGADYVLDKPVSPGRLLAALNKHCAPSPGLAAALSAANSGAARANNVIPLFGQGREPR
jgi:DNA-binding response OmpR family regulator